MPWHFVNSMTWETATHRVRRIGHEHWIAVRKGVGGESAHQLEGKFSSQQDAQQACDEDAAGLAQP
jgi:hypothetical protein